MGQIKTIATDAQEAFKEGRTVNPYLPSEPMHKIWQDSWELAEAEANGSALTEPTDCVNDR